MGKNKKRKIPPSESKNDDGPASKDNGVDEDAGNSMHNPLYREQKSFLSSLTSRERESYFSSQAVNPERRAEIWMDQADVGEGLINQYAWATPTKECLKIFKHFSPIVELGSGSNAYWTKYMKQAGGIDVVAYDMNVQEGGKIRSGQGEKKRKSKTSGSSSSMALVRKGGPEVLELAELQKHTLFLCYPDEEDADENTQLSFGWQCLDAYTGKYVIHVGELAVLGDATLNMEQSPWGRSSSSEFQQRLASEFHCIAKLQLPNWLHVRDSISVWKRSEICQMVFVGDDEDEEDDGEEEVIEYRHIPIEEMLPRSVMAPCMEELLGSSVPIKKESPTSKHTERKKKPKLTENKDDTERVSVKAERSDSTTSMNGILGGKTEQGNTNEAESKKSKNGRRRERQKKKKMQSMQRSPSQNADGETETHQENMNEVESKKSKNERRRERQKKKKMQSMQRSPSQNADDETESQAKKDKKARSDYFRIHGKLPPQS